MAEKLYDWEKFALAKYGSVEEGRRIRSEAGKKSKNTPKSFNRFRDEPGFAKSIRARALNK